MLNQYVLKVLGTLGDEIQNAIDYILHIDKLYRRFRRRSIPQSADFKIIDSETVKHLYD